MATMVSEQGVTVGLPGGRQHHFHSPATVGEALAILDPDRAADAIAARLNGQLTDLAEVILRDATVEYVTAEDDDGLAILRRSCAQLLGYAVKQLYPSAQMVIGRVTDTALTMTSPMNAHSRPRI
ncbi:MAG: hypothetical protein CBARDMAM_6111 [uncultured Caballeronia sp.]|nr:MAG: hypothetical protein CBARDMAM_6111 [uncultured Caballeronia sp.]